MWRSLALCGCREASYLVDTAIRELAEQLDPATFRQVHRSTVVNLRAVAWVEKEEGGGATIHDPPPRARRSSLSQRALPEGPEGLKGTEGCSRSHAVCSSKAAMLSPTPPGKLCDKNGHPYFLWDCEMTLHDLKRALSSSDPEIRAYHMGRLMRQAKPDDVLTLVSVESIRESWDLLEPYLGHTRPFWIWLLDRWRVMDGGQ